MATCSKCTARAVTHIRYSGQHLCRDHFVHFVEKRAKMQLSKQGRLPEGRIAVALSGGKDSVACLHFLAKVTRDNPRTELVAISIDEGIAGYRDAALRICEQVTQDLGVPWHVVRTEDLAGYTIDAYAAGTAGPSGEAAKTLRVAQAGADAARPSCGPCGVFRRQGLNDKARELGAAVLATGHNLDDQAQTILMNVLQGDVDRMARLAPHDSPQKGLVPRLLPFRTIPEKEILLYAMLEGLPVHDEAECPYAARANRFAMRDILLNLEAQQPGTRHRLLRFHEQVKPLVAPSREASKCPSCGQATSGDVCRACLWKA